MGLHVVEALKSDSSCMGILMASIFSYRYLV